MKLHFLLQLGPTRQRFQGYALGFALLLLQCLSGCSTSSSNSEIHSFPNDQWPTSSATESQLKEQGIDSLIKNIRQGTYGYIDQLLILKDGKMVYNESFANDYEKISEGVSGILGCGSNACPPGQEIDLYNYFHPKYHPYYEDSRLHSLQSVTKSIAATVIAVAIQQGHIPDVKVNLLSYFQDYDLSQVDERLKSATLEDLLTMQLGIRWNEMTAPLDTNNQVVQLEASPDWIQYTLNSPMDAAPGEKWAYNSGASHLMAGIIKKATGMEMADFARQQLFEPIGIDTFFWKTTPKGLSDSEGGLYLKAEDLARIGWLYLNDGYWEGQQLLPEGWVAAATKRQAVDLFGDGDNGGYGYQWWRTPDEEEVWAAMGFGNQFLVVVPEKRIMGVINAWNVFEVDGRYIFPELVGVLKDAVK